jgi:hypothetical protein
MAEHVWSVLCERLLADIDTKVANLIGVVERVILHESREQIDRDLEGKHGILHPMRLISWCVRSNPDVEETFELRVTFDSPGGEHIMSTVIPATLKDYGIRVRVAFEGIPWRGPGIYWVVVHKKDKGKRWATAARLPVIVEIQEPG